MNFDEKIRNFDKMIRDEESKMPAKCEKEKSIYERVYESMEILLEKLKIPPDLSLSDKYVYIFAYFKKEKEKLKKKEIKRNEQLTRIRNKYIIVKQNQKLEIEKVKDKIRNCKSKKVDYISDSNKAKKIFKVYYDGIDDLYEFRIDFEAMIKRFNRIKAKINKNKQITITNMDNIKKHIGLLNAKCLKRIDYYNQGLSKYEKVLKDKNERAKNVTHQEGTNSENVLASILNCYVKTGILNVDELFFFKNIFQTIGNNFDTSISCIERINDKTKEKTDQLVTEEKKHISYSSKNIDFEEFNKDLLSYNSGIQCYYDAKNYLNYIYPDSKNIGLFMLNAKELINKYESLRDESVHKYGNVCTQRYFELIRS